jgi:MFS family permease
LHTDAGLGLDEVALTGTIIGMVLFGLLADRLGRKGLYGYELMIILTALGGVAFSSEGYIRPTDDGKGYTSSMDIYAAIFWWRFILGLGIGAEVRPIVSFPGPCSVLPLTQLVSSTQCLPSLLPSSPLQSTAGP